MAGALPKGKNEVTIVQGKNEAGFLANPKDSTAKLYVLRRRECAGLRLKKGEKERRDRVVLLRREKLYVRGKQQIREDPE